MAFSILSQKPATIQEQRPAIRNQTSYQYAKGNTVDWITCAEAWNITHTTPINLEIVSGIDNLVLISIISEK